MRNYDYVPDQLHYDHPDVCGEADSSEDEEQNLERETLTPQGKQSADSDATPSFREIGGVEFWAVRVMKPSRHWKYRVGSQVGNQGFSTRPQMWADLEHAYSLRPDRWTKDWQNFAPKSAHGQAPSDATRAVKEYWENKAIEADQHLLDLHAHQLESGSVVCEFSVNPEPQRDRLKCSHYIKNAKYPRQSNAS